MAGYYSRVNQEPFHRNLSGKLGQLQKTPKTVQHLKAKSMRLSALKHPDLRLRSCCYVMQGLVKFLSELKTEFKMEEAISFPQKGKLKDF